MKRTSPSVRRQGGYSIIEAIVAVVLLTFAGLALAQGFLSSGRAFLAGKNIKKATHLADMVYEQYNSYAIKNFAQLGSHDALTEKTAKEFFNTADNMGYDNMRIRSLSEYSTDGSSVAITVTVLWGEGVKAKEIVFTKYITERSSLLEGGSVDVWVRAADDPSSKPYPGFTVSAPSEIAGYPDITGVTNAAGYVQLHGVRLGDSVDVTATSKMSACNKPPTDSDFKQGYYIPGPSGTYLTTKTVQMRVSEALVSSAVITGFLPAGRVQGQIRNVATDLSDGRGAPGTNLQVKLMGLIGPVGEGSSLYNYMASCTATTRATSDPRVGDYNFSNVIPGNMYIYIKGNAGSYHTVQQSSPTFEWGYSGVPTSDVTVPPSVNGDVPVFQADYTVQRMGWVRVDAVDGSGAPVLGASIATTLPNNGYHGNAQKFWGTAALPVDGSGRLYLYNMFPNCAEVLWFEGFRDPLGGGGDYGQYSVYTPFIYPTPTATACIGNENVQQLVMQPGQRFIGRAVDGSGAALDGVRFIATGQVGRRTLSSTLSDGSAGGSFTAEPFYRPYYGPETILLLGSFEFSSGFPLNSFISGFTYDRLRQANVPNVPLAVSLAAYTPDPAAQTISQTGGAFHLSGEFLSNQSKATGMVTCGTPPNCTGDMTAVNEKIVDITASSVYWEALSTSTVVTPGGVSGVTVRTSLLKYRVYGTITNSAGVPLAGVRVNSEGSQVTTTTNSSGAYDFTVWVMGRKVSHPGYVAVYAPAQTLGGVGYNEYLRSIDVPVPATPGVGLEVNMTLIAGDGESGGTL